MLSQTVRHNQTGRMSPPYLCPAVSLLPQMFVEWLVDWIFTGSTAVSTLCSENMESTLQSSKGNGSPVYFCESAL